MHVYTHTCVLKYVFKKQKPAESLVVGAALRGRVQQLPVVLVLLVHSAPVFPEVLVPLDVQLDQVADLDRVDFSGATVADLKGTNRETWRTSPDFGGHAELRLLGGVHAPCARPCAGCPCIRPW